MEKLRLDLETLEVECLDVTVTGLNGGLESFSMGHASTELGQSCTSHCSPSDCACSGADTGASCTVNECHCTECTPAGGTGK